MILLATFLLLAILAIVFTRRLTWGVFALVCALPFERIGAWALNPATGHPVVRLSQILGAALVAALLVNVTRRRIQLVAPSGPLWLLMAFVAWCGVSLVHIFHPQLIAGYLALVFVATLVYTLYVLVPYVKLPSLQAVLMASAGAVAVFGLYQFVAGSVGVDPAFTGLRAAYTSQVFGFPRVQSTALEPLYFADYLLIPLLVGLAQLLFAPRTLATWQRASLFVVGLSFMLTMSRGAFIGAALGLATLSVVALMWHQRLTVHARGARGIAIGAVAAVVLGIGLVGAASAVTSGSLLRGPSQYIAQLSTKLTKTGSFTERAAMREQALSIIREQSVFGVGIEGITPYLKAYPATRRENDVVALNNQLLELVAESGAIGAILFYAFLIWLLVGAARSLSNLGTHHQAWVLGLIGAVVAITVQAQSFSGFLLTHIWVAYGLLAGVAGQKARDKLLVKP